MGRQPHLKKTALTGVCGVRITRAMKPFMVAVKEGVGSVSCSKCRDAYMRACLKALRGSQ